MAIIDKPSDYFNTKLYSGNGTNDTGITGVGFQADWLWIKERTNTSGHQLQDVVRGATKQLFSNDTQAEATNTTKVKSFNSDGFTLGTSGSVNASGDTYVAWNWKAGTSFTNDASSTGIGTIDSTGSFNNDSGFSIVSYTGTGSNGTIKHGLSTTPSMIIVKKRSATGSWNVYHSSLGNTKAIQLDLTSGPDTNSAYWNNTSPTSSVLSLGTSAQVNGSGVTYIGYIFSEKQSYSKFGSYVGNGNADGPMVYTGFKPAFVMVKLSSGADDWQVLDNKRSPINIVGGYLRPNSSGATVSNDVIDFLSNGFKLRTSAGSWNPNGGTFIYMAFAENPFVASNFNVATAR